ncbi:MAG: nucleotidyltransferase domain-containing protein [Candidatus Aenigmarchaeota archaeon]|nr:nucleotidyltransferase domain-containing protein [Candidatus Aenigmarchaeota archaeon]
MAEKKIVSILKKDFAFLEKDREIMAVMLFGSHATGEATPRSDIDVTIVAPECKDRNALLSRVWQRLGGKYDVRIFENLPLYIRAEIMDRGVVILAKDIPALYEYFYFAVRKFWDDQKHRNLLSREEIKEML